MKRSTAWALSVIATVAAIVACGSGPAADGPSDTDGGSTETPTACGNNLVEGGRCIADASCCVATVASESPANGYRCTAGKWLRDQACVPPPVCTTERGSRSTATVPSENAFEMWRGW